LFFAIGRADLAPFPRLDEPDDPSGLRTPQGAAAGSHALGMMMASLLEASPSRSPAAFQNILKSRRCSCDVVHLKNPILTESRLLIEAQPYP
jgi:hypothetical protein